MASTPVLDLDNLTPHASVRVGGQLIPMRPVEMMPPIERHRLFKIGRRIHALEAKAEHEELTPDEEAELEAAPVQMCKMILHGDDAQLAALTDDQRVEIVAAFLYPSRMQAPAETETPAPNPTGATSPPA